MAEKLAELDSWTILLGLFVVLFLITLLLTSAWTKSKPILTATAAKVSPKKSMRFFSTLIVFLFIIFAILVLAVTRFYTAFTSHELVAIVECYPLHGNGQGAFEVVLTPVVNKSHQEPQHYVIHGDDWSLGGDILEWQSYMNFLGLKSMYRLTRLQGRYDEAEEEMVEEIKAYSLVENEVSSFWENLYDIAVKMPFIKSAHKNFVASHPYFGDYFEVYVTPTGYTLERFEGNAGN